MYFPDNSPLLKSYFSATFILSYLLTSVLTLSSKSAIISLAFSRSFFFSYILCSTVNLFQYTKYFVTSFIFCLLSILSTFYSFSLLTFTGFGPSTLCFFTSFLYLTCQEYSMKCIYSTSQMSKLSLILCTFSVTGSVAGLFLIMSSFQAVSGLTPSKTILFKWIVISMEM